jgi:4-amino-4-deoxy-L-arabinose transferase-like glycosyltransferase
VKTEQVFRNRLMEKRHIFLLFLLGLLTASIVSLWIDVPGYMDAEYYYSTGLSLSTGLGFREQFIWNYLNDPSGFPVPSHQYWMPTTSIIAGLPMALFGSQFKIAQIPFILFTASLPPITAIIAFKLHEDKRLALVSGLFALFSGFFLPFLVTTDTFALYMIIGAAAFWYMSKAITKQDEKLWFAVGLLVGLAHLSRVDGALLFVIAFLGIMLMMNERIKPTAFLIIGYVVFMLPWWIHNFNVTGAIMSTSSTKVLWTLSYDELFSFPANKLTFERWWSAGIGALLRVRLDSTLQNLQSLLLVNGTVFLGPFMIIGVIRFKKHPLVRLSIGYLALLFITMSLIFPFAGARGGFFHSSSAVMPFLWALAPVGLFEAIKFGGEKRGWDLAGARKVFSVASVVLAMATTIGLFYTRVIGPGSTQVGWSSTQIAYEAVFQWFDNSDRQDQLIAINNPPGFFVVSGMKSVVIPDGGLEELRQVTKQFNVDWIVLDSNNPGLLTKILHLFLG